MRRDRVVLDTNVLISGLLSTTSTPARAIERAISGGQLLASTDTLREVMTKLSAPKFDRYVPRERRHALSGLVDAAHRQSSDNNRIPARDKSRFIALYPR